MYEIYTHIQYGMDNLIRMWKVKRGASKGGRKGLRKGVTQLLNCHVFCAWSDCKNLFTVIASLRHPQRLKGHWLRWKEYKVREQMWHSPLLSGCACLEFWLFAIFLYVLFIHNHHCSTVVNKVSVPRLCHKISLTVLHSWHGIKSMIHRLVSHNEM